MDGDDDADRGGVAVNGRCPRCEVCGRVVRVRGVGVDGVWCAVCMGGVLPFAGIESEGEFEEIGKLGGALLFVKCHIISLPSLLTA